MKMKLRETEDSTMTMKEFCERLCTDLFVFSFVMLLAAACLNSLLYVPFVVFYALFALFIFSLALTYYCNIRFVGFFESGFVGIQTNSLTGACIEMVNE